MVFLNQTSRHKQWRKTVKKNRRKRLRQAAAQERDKKLRDEEERLKTSPSYQKWLKEQLILEKQQEEEELKQKQLHELQWKKVEQEAQKQWQELQKKLALAREEKIKQNIKIKLEWEQEQKRLKEEIEKKEQELEEKRKLQEKQEKEIQEFLDNKKSHTPDHLKNNFIESKPGAVECPFYKKTGACRFSDACSRNHIRPCVSKTILIKNFYLHYGLEKVKETEHGSDAGLEYESGDMFLHYKEFFYDVILEMEKIGKIRNFKTCVNHEIHLRGNVYVEYSSTREALLAFRTFNRRWFGGRQLNVEFCTIESWKMAICGLHFTKRCPKGSSCNFMHVFRNPQNLYNEKEDNSKRSTARSSVRLSQRSYRDTDRQRWNDSDRDTDRQRWDDSDDSCDSPKNKHWRWSESPENARISDSTKNNKKKHRQIKKYEKSHKRKKSKSPNGKSSRSSKRHHSRSIKARRKSSSRRSHSRSRSRTPSKSRKRNSRSNRGQKSRSRSKSISSKSSSRSRSRSRSYDRSS